MNQNEQVALLRKSVEEWNQWVENNSDIKIYLQGANLQDANLRGADLQGADLRGTYLQDANLQGVYLQGADLQGANVQDANVQDANLLDANLQGADLRGADLQGAIFDTKSNINLLRHPLSETQLSEAVFLDEEFNQNKQDKVKASPQKLSIIMDNYEGFSPFNLGLFLISLELVYNNFLYLQTTQDSKEDILNKLNHQYYESDKQLAIQQINTGSWELVLTAIIGASVLLPRLATTVEILAKAAKIISEKSTLTV